MTQAIITNLETLLAAVEVQPEGLFDLSMFKQDSSCGTLFCTIGVAACLPHFQAQGLEFGRVQGNNKEVVLINGYAAYNRGVADPIFGPNAFDHLFEPAGLGGFDGDEDIDYDDYSDDMPNMSDKTLAIARIEKQIQLVKGAQQ